MLNIFVEKRKNKTIVTFIILFCLIIVPSLGLASEIRGLFRNENYTIILVSLPQFMHDTETWNRVYSDVSSINILLKNDNIENFIQENSLNDKSIPEVGEIYNGITYINSPEYAYSKIIFPKEHYENITETFRSLGFEVRDHIPVEPSLDHSRSVIGLPYIYQQSENEYELVGWGRIIAIIDSGIDPNHADFQVPSFWDKVIFWNDTTNEQEHDPIDEFGHGTHCAGIAAGREGDCSGTPYPCSHYNGDQIACMSAGCNYLIDTFCTGTPKTCDDYDGHQYSCETNGCIWTENIFKGVAPYAKLKIWKTSADIDHYEAKWIADAINQAVIQEVDVISLSLVTNADINICTGQFTGDIQEWYDAVINAINNDITVVASAGNYGPQNETVGFPACVNEVIAVGATFKKDYDCFTDAYWGYRCWWHNVPNPPDTSINYYINVTSENQYLRWGGYRGSRSDWSGFQEIFSPHVWPTTIEVKVEGKNINGNILGGEVITWDPGGPQSGNPNNPNDNNEFWIRTITFNNGPYIVVELFNFPHVESGLGWWHNWYTEDRIYIRIYKTDSITNQGLPTHYSSRGLAPQGTIKPDLTAPGHDICATRSGSLTQDGCSLSCGNDNYISCSGTSMATPHVAGLVALLKEVTSLSEKNPSVSDIRQALEKANNKVIFSGNPDIMEGYGLINVEKAVNSITCNPDGTSLDGLCEEDCGASFECDEKLPDSFFCNGPIKHTCTNCIATSTGLCESECGASSVCDGFAPGTIIDAHSLEECYRHGYFKSRIKCFSYDYRSPGCREANSYIYDVDCGADPRCDGVGTFERGGCPARYVCLSGNCVEKGGGGAWGCPGRMCTIMAW